MANEVKIEISLEEKQAIDALTKLIKKTDDLNDTVKTNAKESTAAWNVFKGSIAADLLSKGFNLIGKGAKELFKTFILDGIKASAEWKKFRDGINDYIAKNDTVLRLQSELSAAFVKMSQVVKQNEESIKSFIHNAVIIAVKSFEYLIRGIDYTARAFQIIPEAVNIAGQAMITGLLAPLVLVVDGINAVIQSVPILKEKFGVVGEGLKEIFEASAGSAVESIEAIDKKFSESTFLSGIADATRDIGANLEAKKGNPASDPSVVYEQEKQELLAQIKADAEALELEQKALKEEAIGLENETRLINLQEQAEVEGEILKNAEDQKLVNSAKSREDLRNINAKFSKEENDRNRKDLEDQIRREKEAAQIKIANQRDTFSTIATLSSSNNKSLAAIGKAAGITQIAIDTPVAISKALAAFPPPFNFAAAGLVGAAMAAQAARIAGVQGFQTGGFVGGNSIAGDQNLIRANSDEFVATRAQQRNMIESMANGTARGGMDQVNQVIQSAFSQPIVVQINEREIARVTRESRKEGYII
jgi:hypothetical protein